MNNERKKKGMTEDLISLRKMLQSVEEIYKARKSQNAGQRRKEECYKKTALKQKGAKENGN